MHLLQMLFRLLLSKALYVSIAH